MLARIQPSTFDDAFSFHPRSVMVRPIIEGGSLQIEILSPKVVLWNIPGVSWLAIMSMDR